MKHFVGALKPAILNKHKPYKLIMSTKPKTAAPPSASGNAAPSADEPSFRTNPEVDAKIDAHIKENPKYWNYIQAMPRDRLERTVVLNEVRELDRQHRMREGMMKRINANPALKNAYETLVKDLPEDQKEGVIAQIARTARRAVARTQGQQQQSPRPQRRGRNARHP